jgi:WD40 repeat protein
MLQKVRLSMMLKRCLCWSLAVCLSIVGFTAVHAGSSSSATGTVKEVAVVSQLYGARAEAYDNFVASIDLTDYYSPGQLSIRDIIKDTEYNKELPSSITKGALGRNSNNVVSVTAEEGILKVITFNKKTKNFTQNNITHKNILHNQRIHLTPKAGHIVYVEDTNEERKNLVNFKIVSIHDKTVRDISSELEKSEYPFFVALDQHEKFITVASAKKFQIHDFTTGKLLYSYQTQKYDHRISSLASYSYGVDLLFLALGYADGTVKIFKGKKEIHTDKLSLKKVHEFQHEYLYSYVNIVSFSHDGAVLATASKSPGVVKFWDMHTQRLLGAIHRDGEVLSVASGGSIKLDSGRRYEFVVSSSEEYPTLFNIDAKIVEGM